MTLDPTLLTIAVTALVIVLIIAGGLILVGFWRATGDGDPEDRRD